MGPGGEEGAKALGVRPTSGESRCGSLVASDLHLATVRYTEAASGARPVRRLTPPRGSGSVWALSLHGFVERGAGAEQESREAPERPHRASVMRR